MHLNEAKSLCSDLENQVRAQATKLLLITYQAHPGTGGFPGARDFQEHDFLGARASSPRRAAPLRLRGQDARAPRRPRSRESCGTGMSFVRNQETTYHNPS